VQTGPQNSAEAASSFTAIVARAPINTLVLPTLAGFLTCAPWLNFSLYPLAWIAFVPLLYSLTHARSRRETLWLGFVAGMATNVPAFFWLVYTIHVFGGFPYPIAIFFYACLSAFSAMQFVLFAAGFRLLSFGPLGLAVPTLWVTLELLYPNLFPWHMANTQLELPVLLQVGDVTGPYGLSFVMVWFSAALLLALRRPRRATPLAAAVTAVLVVVGYGVIREPHVQAAIDAAPAVRVGLIQGNVGIREKGNAAFFEINAEKYRSLSRTLQEDVDVLIWPESVVHTWVPGDARYLTADEQPFRDLRTYLIYGGLAYSDDGRGKQSRYNSAFLIDESGKIHGRYDKRVLLPFGEYLPGASLFPSLMELSPQTGEFTAGQDLTTLDVPERVRFAPLICYEDVPARIARGMTQRGAQALLTIFNDAWFGDSMAPYQHEAIALWRAIENRRYFVRVGNAGATGTVDPFGRIVDRLGLFTAESLTAEIRPLNLETFYTRHGDVFGWLVTAAAGLSLAWAAVVRRRGGES
jgi:apolipoprotein N-acyltransferase